MGVNSLIHLVWYTEKDNYLISCMDVYKAKLQSDGSRYKLKLGIVVI